MLHIHGNKPRTLTFWKSHLYAEVIFRCKLLVLVQTHLKNDNNFRFQKHKSDDHLQYLNDLEPSRCPPCSGVSFWPEDSRTVKVTILRFHLRQQGSNVSPLLSSFLNPTGASWVIRSLTVAYFSEHRVFPNMLIKSFSKADEMCLIWKNLWLLYLVLSLQTLPMK